MLHFTSHRLVALASLAALLFASAGASQERSAPPQATAKAYAEAFFSADQQTMDALHDATMKTAMGAAAAEATRKALATQLGDLESLEAAWSFDEVQSYRRFRVPAKFEKQLVDILVVLDSEGAVAGFSVVPFLEQLENEPTTPGSEFDFEVGEEGSGTSALPGTLLLPEGSGPFPAVVLVHGSGPSDRDGTFGPNKTLRDVAWGLAEHGIASLRYEKRSKHDPQSLIADGPNFTLVEEAISDAQVAIRALRAHPEVDGQKVFVVGHSLGGNAAPRVAQMEPPPAGVIVLAGMTRPFAEKIVEQTEYIVNVDGVVTDQEKQQLKAVQEAADTINKALSVSENGAGPDPEGYFIGAPIAYYRDLEANSPATIAVASKHPIFVLHGDRDYQVTSKDFAVWEEALGDSDFACLARYPKLNHHFHEGEEPSTPAEYQVRAKVSETVIVDVARWINAGICPPR